MAPSNAFYSLIPETLIGTDIATSRALAQRFPMHAIVVAGKAALVDLNAAI
jgi:hypothetical protein